jgi:hypothetical protein
MQGLFQSTHPSFKKVHSSLSEAEQAALSAVLEKVKKTINTRQLSTVSRNIMFLLKRQILFKHKKDKGEVGEEKRAEKDKESPVTVLIVSGGVSPEVPALLALAKVFNLNLKIISLELNGELVKEATSIYENFSNEVAFFQADATKSSWIKECGLGKATVDLAIVRHLQYVPGFDVQSIFGRGVPYVLKPNAPLFVSFHYESEVNVCFPSFQLLCAKDSKGRKVYELNNSVEACYPKALGWQRSHFMDKYSLVMTYSPEVQCKVTLSNGEIVWDRTAVPSQEQIAAVPRLKVQQEESWLQCSARFLPTIGVVLAITAAGIVAANSMRQSPR